MDTNTKIELPFGFEDAAAIQVGPRTWKIAIQGSHKAWSEVHQTYATMYGDYVVTKGSYRTAQAAIDVAQAMRKQHCQNLGLQFVRPKGDVQHQISVWYSNKKTVQYQTGGGRLDYWPLPDRRNEK